MEEGIFVNVHSGNMLPSTFTGKFSYHLLFSNLKYLRGNFQLQTRLEVYLRFHGLNNQPISCVSMNEFVMFMVVGIGFQLWDVDDY